MTWDFADVLGRRLVFWGLLSVVVGLGPAVAGDPFWRGIGLMFLAWGAVDGVLGAGARWLAERNRRASIGDVPRRDRDRARLRTILLVNAGLDVAYLVFGAWLLAGSGSDAWRAGAGWGIVVQGGFLLAFDLLHARFVPAPGPLLPEGLALFTGSGHEPFRLERVPDADAGAPDPGSASAQGSASNPGSASVLGPASVHRPEPVRGALLVHGLSGSPREMRGLAAVLASSGWVVEVPRLPGHGPRIRDIADYRVEDWIAEVEAGAAALRASGVMQLVVVGHSVGGALALATCARVAPDAIVLLAPFWVPLPRWQRLVAPVLRVFLPAGFRIFGQLDPGDPAARGPLAGFLPGADLDDPSTVASLRQVQIPVSLMEQLFRVSALAGAAAPSVRVPVLVVQGTEDTVSRPERTRRLVGMLPGVPSFIEVTAGHDLVTEASPARDQVLAAVLAFATEVTRPSRFEQPAEAHVHGAAGGGHPHGGGHAHGVPPHT